MRALRKHPAIVALVCLVIGLGVIELPISGMWGMAAARFAASAFMIAVIAAMGGGESLASMEGFGWSMKKCTYLLILMFAMGAFVTYGSIKASGVPEGWLGQELAYLVFCLSVGLFEESLFRGVIFGAMLKTMGETQKGVMWAAVLSSLLFGLVHVLSYLVGGSYDPLGLLQSVLKTLQTAALAVLMAALYAKTKNLWAIALAHAVNDFFPMQSFIFSGNSLGSYVNEGAAGIASAVIYAIQFVLYIPLIVAGVRILKEIETPERGAFRD